MARGSALGMAAHFINVIKDMKEVHVSGINGLPQKLGTKGSIASATILIALGITTLVLFL